MLDGVLPISFDLYYNSQRTEHWRHSYSRTLKLINNLSEETRYNFTGDSFDFGDPFYDESNGGFSSSINAASYGVDESSDIGMIFTTREAACVSGWSHYKSRLHYSWITGSVAEYVNGGKCKILDGNGVQRKLVDIYSLYSGRVAAVGASAVLNKLRFTRQDGRVVVFKRDVSIDPWENLSRSGEIVEDIIENTELAGFRLFTTSNDIETYDISGKLLTITSPQGVVQTLTYDPVTERLQRVESSTGEYLEFFYEQFGDTNSYSRISSISDHASRSWGFIYDLDGNLSNINFPDQTTREFRYENQDNLRLLTGITDERGTRYANWAYDLDGRAISSSHGPLRNIDRVDIVYSPTESDERTVTQTRISSVTAIETEIVTQYQSNISGAGPLISEISGPACCGASNVAYQHDFETGYLESKVENGVTTLYGNYDDSGNPGYITEAAGTNEERRKDYTYDSRFVSKVATIQEPSVYPGLNKITTYSYDDYSNLTSITISGNRPDGTAVSRSMTLQYQGPYHQLSQIDGPRMDVSDITRFEYYPDDAGQGNNRARLRRVTGPDNVALRDNIQYSTTGRIVSESRSNGLDLAYAYYPGNDRLETLQLTDLQTGQVRIIRWTYLDTGEVDTITTGYNTTDATTLTLGYDEARRLTRITDGVGHYIEYVLDSEGNVEQENYYDAGDVLVKSLNQTFDLYNRLDQFTQLNENLDVNFDPDGTLDRATDGKGAVTDYNYDGLRRLTEVIADANGSDPATGNARVQYGYDAQDRVIRVTDPNDHDTLYRYDDLGNLLSLDSSDTGLTAMNYDEAGNLLTRQDANGQLFTYHYDAYNRLTAIDVADDAHDISYSYDSCNQGHGRLCSITYGSQPPVSYAYNAFGDITQHQGYSYQYDHAGRRQAITYPSGDVLHYHYDAAGQIDDVQLTLNGTATPITLASAISYHPFGDIDQLSYGNGLSLDQDFDTAYRSQRLSVPYALDLNYSDYDANGNLTDVQDGLDGYSYSYDYDALNRIIDSQSYDANPSSNNGDTLVSYVYDKTGNRSQFTRTLTQSYEIDPDSNWISRMPPYNLPYSHNEQIYQKDANGNRTLYRYKFFHWGEVGADGYSMYDTVYQYTPYNRLSDVTRQYLEEDLNGNPRVDGDIEIVGQYTYNGLGQRISKTDDQIISYIRYPDVTTQFSYGLDGELLGDSNSLGTDNAYYYLNGRLLAMQRNGRLYYIHNDHLGTPRAVTSSTGVRVWAQYHKEAFRGVNDVREFIDETGEYFAFHLRFPGQYYDQATGLFYNYYRYYDPEMGRYITSDPVGLNGGINTYAYVRNNPFKYTDPYGLCPLGGAICVPVVMGIIEGGIAVAGAWGIYNSTKGKNTIPPYNGPPNGYIDGPRRGRDYGPDGLPLRDYDKPHQGHDSPHVHEWEDGKREHPGRDYSPIPRPDEDEPKSCDD